MLHNSKMEEAPIQQIEETTEAASSNEPEHEPAPVEAAKKRGRPAGAKDSAPRKKKTTIVVEPLAPPPQPIAQPSPTVEPPKAQPAMQPEVAAPASPQSPRTLMRDASRHILQLQRLKEDTRKSYMQNSYTQHLHAF